MLDVFYYPLLTFGSKTSGKKVDGKKSMTVEKTPTKAQVM